LLLELLIQSLLVLAAYTKVGQIAGQMVAIRFLVLLPQQAVAAAVEGLLMVALAALVEVAVAVVVLTAGALVHPGKEILEELAFVGAVQMVLLVEVVALLV
jgi:hypothetical protein